MLNIIERGCSELKPFETLSSKTQHIRVGNLLKRYSKHEEKISVTAAILDAAELSEMDKDTWLSLRKRWVEFGWI